MTKEERCRKAVACHGTSLNCAQSVLCAFSDRVGWPEERCQAVASGFGGGVRYGGICGALSGAVMVLGLLYPHTSENGVEGKARSTELTRELESRFTRYFGSLDCRDLLSAHTLHGTELTEQLHITGGCDILIASAVELLWDMLDELEKE